MSSIQSEIKVRFQYTYIIQEGINFHNRTWILFRFLKPEWTHSKMTCTGQNVVSVSSTYYGEIQCTSFQNQVCKNEDVNPRLEETKGFNFQMMNSLTVNPSAPVISNAQLTIHTACLSFFIFLSSHFSWTNTFSRQWITGSIDTCPVFSWASIIGNEASISYIWKVG